MCLTPCDSKRLLRNLWLHRKSTHISCTWWMGGKLWKAWPSKRIWSHNPYLEANRTDAYFLPCYHYLLCMAKKIFLIYLLTFGGSCALIYKLLVTHNLKLQLDSKLITTNLPTVYLGDALTSQSIHPKLLKNTTHFLCAKETNNQQSWDLINLKHHNKWNHCTDQNQWEKHHNHQEQQLTVKIVKTDKASQPSKSVNTSRTNNS